jgi:hypothetical protein
MAFVLKVAKELGDARIRGAASIAEITENVSPLDGYPLKVGGHQASGSGRVEVHVAVAHDDHRTLHRGVVGSSVIVGHVVRRGRVCRDGAVRVG